MAKYVNPNTIDLALSDFKNANKMTLCSAMPASYADANANYMLAAVAMAPADYTLANGDVSGRKVTVAAKPATPVTTSGTAVYAALIDTVNQILKAVTTVSSTAVAAGGTVDISAWKDEIQAPS